MPMFELLTENQLECVISALMVHHFHDGTAIIKEGEQGDLLYIVKEGWVTIERKHEGVEFS